MKTATVKQIKEELKLKSQDELVSLCLHLSKFKKENKELLTYLLYESTNEEQFIREVKEEVEMQFTEINTASFYYVKKSIRKILRNIKKYIRYSKKKETEVELLLFYCKTLKKVFPEHRNNTTFNNIKERQIVLIRKAMKGFHEDLQYDYEVELLEILG